MSDTPEVQEYTPEEQALRDALRAVTDPELDMNIVELGLVRQISFQPDFTEIKMIMTRRSSRMAQSSGQLGGFKAQGRSAEAALELIEDARAIQNAGAFSLLIEAVPPEVCKIIRDELTFPVYSIGAGIDADRQLMIVSDILGIFQAFTAKFVKKYANLGAETLKAMEAYAEDVRKGKFPEAHTPTIMVEGELPKLKAALKKMKPGPKK